MTPPSRQRNASRTRGRRRPASLASYITCPIMWHYYGVDAECNVRDSHVAGG